MAIAEDDEVLSTLEAAAQLAPDSGGTWRGGALTKAHLAEMYGVLAGRQLIPSSYVMHPTMYTDILKFNSTELDQVSLNVIVETGQFGVIFGNRLIVSTRVAANSHQAVYLVTTPDKLGRMPERKAVEVKIFDNVREAQYDVVAWEQIGIGIHNPAGVTKSRNTQ